MASKLALSLVIGGAVASSVGAAFRTVESGIDKLKKKGDKAKVLQSTIGETITLQREWKKAHEAGAAGADKLLRKLNGNLDTLRRQGVEVGRLGKEYQRLGRDAKAADLQVKGHERIAAGRASLKSTAGTAAVGIGLTAVPTKISADYQAIIRDIAIKADAVNQPEEVQLSRSVIQTSNETGMARNDVADLINQLVGAGMELEKAMAYSKTAAKFAVGQGSSGVDTASMIMALQQNAKITDPKVMQQALEAIAYQGQAGSFEASDMAKWFPQLLAGMEKNGITGLDAVSSLGSMLQVQMKTAGSSDEAANNFKNWMEKIGSGDVVKAYKDVGIDYQASLNTGLQKGMNVIEASMGLAMQYVQATDPAKAQKIKDAQSKIDKQADPEKARAALEALEKTLRTGDLFADMQVKAALTAYGQNRGLYNELKADAMKSSGILDKNLAERRGTSAQMWAETAQAADDAMRSIGDAIRPATDMAAQGLTAVAQGITKMSDDLPNVVMGITGVVSAVLAFKSVAGAFKIGRGLLDIARGKLLDRGGDAKDVQKVFVTNPSDGDGGGEEPKTRREKLLGLVETGLKSFKGEEKPDADGEESDTAGPAKRPFSLVDTGLKVLDAVREAGGDDGNEGGGEDREDAGPKKVFVVNASDFAGMGGGDGGGRNGRRRNPRGRRTERRRSASGANPPLPGPRPSPGPRPPSPGPRPSPRPRPPVPRGLGRIGSAMSLMGGIAAVGKRLPGGNIMDAGASILDTAMSDGTREEKAEGYGQAAGGLAGSLAGAAAGAAIGSVVPVIGTAIGGAIGMALGSMGGESLGGWLGRSLFGDDEDEEKPQQDKKEDGDKQDEAVPQSAAPAPVAAMPAPVLKLSKGVPSTVQPPVVMPPAQPVTVTQSPVATLPEPIARPPAPVTQGLTPPQVPVTVQSPVVTVTAPDLRQPAPVVKVERDSPPAPVKFSWQPHVAMPLQASPRPEPAVAAAVPAKSKQEPVAAVPAQGRPYKQEPVAPAPVPDLGQVFRPPVAVAPAPVVVEVPKPESRERPAVAPGLRRHAAEQAGSMGDVVRSLVEPAPVAAAPSPPKPAERNKSEPPKVEQSFSIALSMPVTIEGDVKDPYQTVAAMETPLRGLFERLQREFAGNRFSAQLYDEAHI
nr:phage tail tape measure protein [uncultured Pseudomonas sp.]